MSRIGLVTDVHNHAAALARVLDLFRARAVDRVVCLGDTVDAFSRGGGAAEVAALLAGVGAVGVWGNHDFTLCRDVDDRTRGRYPPAVFSTMSRMEPRLVVENCHFSHKEASADPFDVAQLWDASDRPLDLLERARLAFSAVDSPWQFVGHYHRWWAATPAGRVDWDGSAPLHLAPDQRYFVVVAAVCDGWGAVLDTDRGELDPLRCGL